jgi:hypothetical protein
MNNLCILARAPGGQMQGAATQAMGCHRQGAATQKIPAHRRAPASDAGAGSKMYALVIDRPLMKLMAAASPAILEVIHMPKGEETDD